MILSQIEKKMLSFATIMQSIIVQMCKSART